LAVITKISWQKDGKKVNLFLDGKYAFSLLAEDVISFGLKKNQELSEGQIQDLYFASHYEKFLAKTLNLLSYRPRSRKEIADYLGRHFYKQKIPEKLKLKLKKKVLDELKRRKLLDDKAFASWWIEQRLKFRPKGRKMLKFELYKKGIDKDIIKLLLSNLNNQNLILKARQLAEKKLRLLKDKPFMEKKKKLYNYLLRRGFSYKIIKTIIDEILEK
jgi:regulatory protein